MSKLAFLSILVTLLACMMAGALLHSVSYLDFTPVYDDLDTYGVPVGYYGMKSPIPEDVNTWEWLTEHKWAEEYEMNAFDCSQMATYVEWALETRGVRTDIIVGTVEEDGKSYPHAWVRIYLDGSVIYYETTSRRIISDTEYQKYHELDCYYSIYTIAKFLYAHGYKHIFLMEYGWWMDD